MNAISNAARELRTLAENMERLNVSLSICPNDITISEACTRLRSILPERSYCSINLAVNMFQNTDEPSVEWKIYDGKEFFEGPTLKIAIEKCLASHKPEANVPPADAMKDADRLVSVEAANNMPF